MDFTTIVTLKRLYVSGHLFRMESSTYRVVPYKSGQQSLTNECVIILL